MFDFEEAHCSSAVLVVDDAEGEGVAAFMDRYPSVCVGAGAAALEGLAPSSLGSVLFATSAPWEELLPGALAALKPNGRLVVRQPAAAFAREDASMALLLGGFVDAVLPDESLFAAAADAGGTTVVQMLAAKPAWETGDSAPIAAAAAPATASAAVPAWKLLAGGGDDADDDAELEDEDALLGATCSCPSPPPTAARQRQARRSARARIARAGSRSWRRRRRPRASR